MTEQIKKCVVKLNEGFISIRIICITSCRQHSSPSPGFEPRSEACKVDDLPKCKLLFYIYLRVQHNSLAAHWLLVQIPVGIFFKLTNSRIETPIAKTNSFFLPHVNWLLKAVLLLNFRCYPMIFDSLKVDQTWNNNIWFICVSYPSYKHTFTQKVCAQFQPYFNPIWQHCTSFICQCLQSIAFIQNHCFVS